MAPRDIPTLAAGFIKAGNNNHRPTKIPLYPLTLHRPYFSLHRVKKSPLSCHCLGNDQPAKAGDLAEKQGFSVLSPEIPWEEGDVWWTVALYMCNLHVPVGICGLSVIAYVLRRPVLDPQTEALSLLGIQMLELAGTLILLRGTARSDLKLVNFFMDKEVKEERNWILASALGLGLVILLIFLLALLLDTVFGSQDANNPVLQEMLSSGDAAKCACVLVYCVVTPILEETVYRGFLLTSLASTMSWQKAVLLSSVVFSAAHFSVENFPQLFIIGCVLGCCYCWTGKLSSSFAIHSLYNAVTLIISSLS